jgi:hypothetical protein
MREMKRERGRVNLIVAVQHIGYNRAARHACETLVLEGSRRKRSDLLKRVFTFDFSRHPIGFHEKSATRAQRDFVVDFGALAEQRLHIAVQNSTERTVQRERYRGWLRNNTTRLVTLACMDTRPSPIEMFFDQLF